MKVMLHEAVEGSRQPEQAAAPSLRRLGDKDNLGYKFTQLYSTIGLLQELVEANVTVHDMLAEQADRLMYLESSNATAYDMIADLGSSNATAFDKLADHEARLQDEEDATAAQACVVFSACSDLD